MPELCCGTLCACIAQQKFADLLYIVALSHKKSHKKFWIETSYISLIYVQLFTCSATLIASLHLVENFIYLWFLMVILFITIHWWSKWTVALASNVPVIKTLSMPLDVMLHVLLQVHFFVVAHRLLYNKNPATKLFYVISFNHCQEHLSTCTTFSVKCYDILCTSWCCTMVVK